MSAVLTHAPGKLHAPSDDLESTMHVLSWMVLRCLWNPFAEIPQELDSYMRTMFEDCVPITDTRGNTRYRCNKDRYLKVKWGIPLAVLSKAYNSHPLARLLERLAGLCRAHYATVSYLVPGEALPSPGPPTSYRPFDPEDYRDPDTDPDPASPARETPQPASPTPKQLPPSPEPSAAGSPLKGHDEFLQAFEDALAVWPADYDIPRQKARALAAGGPGANATPCGVRTCISRKRPAPSASGSVCAKRGRRDSGTAGSVASSGTASDC